MANLYFIDMFCLFVFNIMLFMLFVNILLIFFLVSFLFLFLFIISLFDYLHFDFHLGKMKEGRTIKFFPL
ncbi:MAG: hypothetical protein H6Q13_944 [Bacteroidetes bacterium]|nr:hypothetical protein [Bacteroidota bacterium]